MAMQNYWLQPDAFNAPLIARTQRDIDALSRGNTPFLIVGGTIREPLIIRRACGFPIAVGPNSNVAVIPDVVSHPPEVVVTGDHARVSGYRNAHIISYADCTVDAYDISKVRMFKGHLRAWNKSRCTLYDRATGEFHDRSKGFCRNQSRADLYGRSLVRLYHQAKINICENTATLWIRDFAHGSVRESYPLFD